MHEVVYATPQLESTNSSGRKKFWQAFVLELSGLDALDPHTNQQIDVAAHYTTSWQETASGELSKKNRSEMTKVVGKNIGRANETTPLDQAKSEVESLMNKKIDEGYHEAGVESTVLPLPMLAHKFVDRGKALKYPCFVQPKLDGNRALYDGTKFWTRKGKLYIPECVQHLQFNTNGAILDGEIMLPLDFTFQETTSAIKKPNKNTPKLEYYVFDIVDPDIRFEERYYRLQEVLETMNPPENVRLVKTILCSTEDDATAWLNKSLRLGYEGLILRNIDGLYAIGQRSVDLQKLKTFVDAEYEIVDCVDGKGREEGAILYVCQLADGSGQFTVRPEGTISERKTLWHDFCKKISVPIGKMLTVKYQNLTDEGFPRFPVGVGVRDYE